MPAEPASTPLPPRVALGAGRSVGLSEALLTLPTGVGVRRLHSDDIWLVAANGNYTTVTLAQAERVIVRKTMLQWAGVLPPEQFARLHRGLFVNLGKVIHTGKGVGHETSLHFISSTLPAIVVKRRHQPALRGKLKKWRIVLHSLGTNRPEPGESIQPNTAQGSLPTLQQGAAREATDQRLHTGAAAPYPTEAMNVRIRWLVQEGLYFFSLRTQGSFKLAETTFTQALAFDPLCASAHLGLAKVCQMRALHRLVEGMQDVVADLRLARASARRALQFDPSLAQAHTVLGMVYLHEGKLTSSERECQRSLSLAPNYATGHHCYAWTLCTQGRIDRALVVYAQAIALDPLSFINLDRYAAMLALAGRFSDALAANERAALLRPAKFVGNLAQRGRILLALGRRKEAIAVARTVRTIALDTHSNCRWLHNFLFVLHQTGHADEAQAFAAPWLDRLHPENYLRGFILAAIGRGTDSIPFLRFAPTIRLPFLFMSALWEGVRDDPPFQDLIAHFGRQKEYRLARTAIMRVNARAVS